MQGSRGRRLGPPGPCGTGPACLPAMSPLHPSIMPSGKSCRLTLSQLGETDGALQRRPSRRSTQHMGQRSCCPCTGAVGRLLLTQMCPAAANPNRQARGWAHSSRMHRRPQPAVKVAGGPRHVTAAAPAATALKPACAGPPQRLLSLPAHPQHQFRRPPAPRAAPAPVAEAKTRGLPRHGRHTAPRQQAAPALAGQGGGARQERQRGGGGGRGGAPCPRRRLPGAAGHHPDAHHPQHHPRAARAGCGRAGQGGAPPRAAALPARGLGPPGRDQHVLACPGSSPAAPRAAQLPVASAAARRRSPPPLGSSCPAADAAAAAPCLPVCLQLLQQPAALQQAGVRQRR